MRVHWIVFAELLLAMTGASAYYYWPESLAFPRTPIPQTISESNGQTVVSWPGRVFVAKIGEFDTALSAYLMSDYLRSQDPLVRARQVLLTANNTSAGRPYSLSVHLPDDVLAGVQELALLNENQLTPVLEDSWITSHEFSDDLHQTD